MNRPTPCDLDAERHVIGACLVQPDLVDVAAQVVNSSDFVAPSHAATFAAMVELRSVGEPVDAHSVARKVNGSGMAAGDMVTAMRSVPALGHVEAYARSVANEAARRQLIVLADHLLDAAYGTGDPSETVESAKVALEAVDLPAARVPADLTRLADLVNRPDDRRAPWVVPGLLRRDWRVVLVAPEGVGKSLVLQGVGMCAAQGVHPFAFDQIPPVRVLFVDLENPEERIVHGAQLIDPQLRRTAGEYDEDRVWIWSRPAGINLRTRSDRAALEAVLSKVRPQLVCMGPAYKASAKEKGEGWDDQALATQRVLDQLRVRYSFALLMEDHAPQASGGVRDLRPFGSSAWLRWPEIGLKLAPDNPQHPTKLTVSRWRGDRLPNAWPSELHRGDLWPWEGRWAKGRAS